MPLPIDAPVQYLVELNITPGDEYNTELFKVRKARNLAINGDEKTLPIKTWFDAPDWRPDCWDRKLVK